MADRYDDLTLANEVSVESTIDTESAVTKKETPAEKKQREADAKTIKKAIKQFRSIVRGEQFYRQQAVEDMKFRAGTWGTKSFQWPEGMLEKRREQKQVTITINRIPGSIQQVTNQARQAHLSIRVSAVDNKNDPKVAEVFQGIIRNIEQQSFADRAYYMAADKQAEQGRGCFRLITKFADDGTMRQVIRLIRERNPLSVFWDVSAKEADYSDAWFAFQASDLDEDAFEEATGEAPPSDAQVTAFVGDNENGEKDWFPNKKTRLMEWVNREPDGEKFTLVELSNGECIPEPDEKGLRILKRGGITVTEKSRVVQKYKWVWRKLTALKIYEETIWPGGANPWIPVLGTEYEIDGEVDYRGVTRDAKEPARAYNVETAALLGAVGQGVKAPVVGWKGQFGKQGTAQRKAWETASEVPHPFLELDPMDIDGKPAPMAQRMQFEVPIDGIISAIRQSDEDYKTTSGFRDASLGVAGPQESADAIKARQRQDELGSSHYLDNLRFALCSAGRQLIKLIRATMDVPTIVRITGDDDRERPVLVYSGKDMNPRHPKYLKTHPRTAAPLTTKDGTVVQPGEKIPYEMPDGVKEIYDLSVGEFHIEVSAGPDPGTRRQEQVDTIADVLKFMPPDLSSKMLDLFLQLFDLPVVRQMAERVKMLTGMQDDEGGAMADLPPEAKAIILKMQQELQQAKQQLQDAGMKLATGQPKIDSAEKIAAAKFQHEESLAKMDQLTELLTNASSNETKLGVAELAAKVERYGLMIEESKLVGERQEALLGRLHDSVHQMLQRGHERVMQQADHALSRETAPQIAAVPPPVDASGVTPTEGA